VRAEPDPSDDAALDHPGAVVDDVRLVQFTKVRPHPGPPRPSPILRSSTVISLPPAPRFAAGSRYRRADRFEFTGVESLKIRCHLERRERRFHRRELRSGQPMKPGHLPPVGHRSSDLSQSFARFRFAEPEEVSDHQGCR